MDPWGGGSPTLVRFKVGFPGFEPLSEKHKPCMSLNTYRKRASAHTLIIDCLLHKPEGGVQHEPVCSNHSRLANGNVLAYYLHGRQHPRCRANGRGRPRTAAVFWRYRQMKAALLLARSA